MLVEDVDVPEGHLADLLPCPEDDHLRKTKQSRADAPWEVVEWLVSVTVEPYTKVAWHSLWR